MPLDDGPSAVTITFDGDDKFILQGVKRDAKVTFVRAEFGEPLVGR